MNLAHSRILITGATGGIGAATAQALVSGGAKVLLTARDELTLQRLARDLDPHGEAVGVHAADLTNADDVRELVDAARSWNGGVNVLINNAGVAAAGMLADARAADIERAFAVNAIAPMKLCKALLPHLKRQPRARILNVGSVFGAIAHPGHSVYSATKFALRGFSEALRRELSDTNVRVQYLAPRATHTKFNEDAVEALNAELGVATDPPEHVAASVRRLLESGRAEAVVGWPEKLFVRINAVLPRLVDRSLARQLPAIRRRLGGPHAAAPASVQPLSRKAS